MPQAKIEEGQQCGGHARGLFTPHVPGVQWRFGAMGSAEWTGVRLKDVLALAGPKQDAAFVQLQGAEKPAMSATPKFIRAIPLAKAIHPDTLLALKRTGTPLAIQRHRPALWVPPAQ